MLNIDTLVTSYPDWRVSFSAKLPKGEITALIGPSGAGKSTLLGMIAGFVPVESGSLSFEGEDLLPLGPAERPVTTLFQDHNLFLHLSVFDNIAIVLHPGLRLNAAHRARRRACPQVCLQLHGNGPAGAGYPRRDPGSAPAHRGEPK